MVDKIQRMYDDMFKAIFQIMRTKKVVRYGNKRYQYSLKRINQIGKLMKSCKRLYEYYDEIKEYK
ncbi:MAG: hypothetical protein ACPKQO_02145 [Nitrososphaeraceae archaeon]